jgi:hypothetical protein
MRQRLLAQKQQENWELEEKYYSVLNDEMLIKLREPLNR